jgi:hypothetical protein
LPSFDAAPEDVMDRAIVLVHELAQAGRISSLGLPKQIGNFWVACGRIGHGVSPFCRSNADVSQHMKAETPLPCKNNNSQPV